ncbi:GNAT family N-acetyltransferase [Brachybacterium sp. MASK1Z-5]|uniref:GNAT family N-acetyltransferase n=1 Tax=Brachybacterium halotolerans TaxID=2795215 RepID=A0ABS1BAQ4_9MICO|nr:GNAT family protein [Brachybacterium halotolerans]MBK0331734.1 GNAT family N-acetyltransferase [Brachybacterium halotolerans]
MPASPTPDQPLPDQALPDRSSPVGPPQDLDALHPPFALRVRSGPLTLRVLADRDLPEYAELLRRPIFVDPDAPHVFPWYARPEQERIREAMRFQWRLRSELSPESWSLPLGIWADGRLIGCQDVKGKQFAVRRTVTSGSWLTRDMQGRGYGGLMRRAVLVLAFDHLGAVRAESAAVVGNERSYGVSRSCGYVDDGTEIIEQNGRAVEHQRFLVTPQTFRRGSRSVEVEGLTPELRALLGAPPAGAETV